MNGPHLKRCLILGANGRLGRLLQRRWQQSELTGWQPIWSARAPAADIDVVWQPGDQAPTSAEAVVALWGAVPGRGALEDNTKLAKAAMALGRACGARRVLHCSSVAVYGPGRRLREDTLCAPANAYGVAKLAMEAAIRAAKDAHPEGPQACAMRLANVVGADSLFAALDSGATITLDKFPDGQGPRRSYAAPSVILYAIEALLAAEVLPEVINVAAPNTVSMADITTAAQRDFTWQVAPDTALAEVAVDTQTLQALSRKLGSMRPVDLVKEWRALTEGTT